MTISFYRLYRAYYTAEPLALLADLEAIPFHAKQTTSAYAYHSPRVTPKQNVPRRCAYHTTTHTFDR